MDVQKKLFEVLASALISVSSFLAPMWVPFCLIGGLNMVDLITGVRASRKRGEVFTLSRAWTWTMDKFTWQGAAILTCGLLRYFLFPKAPLIDICMWSVVLIQLQSIRENIKTLSGFDVLKDPVKMVRQLRSK